MDTREGAQLHQTVEFLGLRAHATAIGLLQLSAELARAGVLDEDAIARIKEAIAKDLRLSRPSSLSSEEFDRLTRLRLDRLFSGEELLSPISPPPL